MRIKFLLMALLLAGGIVGVWHGRVLSGEIGSANAGLEPQQYLPVVHNLFCSGTFFDDFSRESSGWPTGSNEFLEVSYFNEEYRLLTIQSGFFYLFRAPTCDRDNYVVEVDVRWDGEKGNSYGLLFDITPGFEEYYLFDMNSDLQLFRVLRRSPTGFSDVVPVTASPAIVTGTGTNHIGVTRDGASMTLFVNGTTLGTWNDGTISGAANVGVVSSANPNPAVSDARFDNFSVAALATTAKGPTAVSQPAAGSHSQIEPAPAGWAWPIPQQ